MLPLGLSGALVLVPGGFIERRDDLHSFLEIVVLLQKCPKWLEVTNDCADLKQS